MRIVYLNVNYELKEGRGSRRLSNWLAEVKADLFIAALACEEKKYPSFELDGYAALGGSSKIYVWSKLKTARPIVNFVCEDRLMLSFDDFNLISLVLNQNSFEARSEQLQMISEEINNLDKKNLLIGDFNLAPNAVDGWFGASHIQQNTAAERKGFSNFLSEFNLVDMTTSDRIGAQEFSFESMVRGDWLRLRSDLALVDGDLAEKCEAGYDHSPRHGSDAFADHSAVILDISDQEIKEND